MRFAILIGLGLVAATVAIHAVGLAALLRALARPEVLSGQRVWAVTWLLVRIVWALILIHVLEISVWAAFYLAWGCLPDAESALYFSGVTYTGIGYGDLVLPEPWRMLAPIEGLTGILMCGLSTGLFFAVVSKIYVARVKLDPR